MQRPPDSPHYVYWVELLPEPDGYHRPYWGKVKHFYLKESWAKRKAELWAPAIVHRHKLDIWDEVEYYPYVDIESIEYGDRVREIDSKLGAHVPYEKESPWY